MDKSKFYCYKWEHFIHWNVYEKHVSNSNCAKSDFHRCTLCGKGFSSPHYLDNHQKIHSNDKKYQCSFCTKSFHQKGNLQTHRKKKHEWLLYNLRIIFEDIYIFMRSLILPMDGYLIMTDATTSIPHSHIMRTHKHQIPYSFGFWVK